jgi:Fur family transcriptional regulator, ferric uptake regulator
MTASPHVRAARFDDLEGAIAVLRASGSRLSSARKELLRALFAADGPVSAERLARSRGGEPEAADLASVYRNLELLESLGIVRHVHLGHGPGLYALAASHEREYLVCERCDAVRTVAAAELDELRDGIRDAYGFEVRFSHFPIAGLCAACAASVGSEPDLDSKRHHEGGPMSDEHDHDDGHAHEHSHGDVSHTHAHDEHEHEHVEHVHEHSHGDEVHSHPHVHQEGLEQDHEHDH